MYIDLSHRCLQATTHVYSIQSFKSIAVMAVSFMAPISVVFLSPSYPNPGAQSSSVRSDTRAPHHDNLHSTGGALVLATISQNDTVENIASRRPIRTIQKNKHLGNVPVSIDFPPLNLTPCMPHGIMSM